MTPLEKDIEQTLVKMVRKRGGLCLKWVCPGWAGVPDRIVLLPGGKIIFVELKRPSGGVLSDRQKWWAKKLIDMDFSHWLIWSFEDLSLFCAMELLGGRER
jgi:hypothetical protein